MKGNQSLRNGRTEPNVRPWPLEDRHALESCLPSPQLMSVVGHLAEIRSKADIRRFTDTSAWTERRRRLGGGHAVPIESGEIDRLKQQRWKAPVAGRRGDDFPDERKQQVWALDHDYRLKAFGR